MFAHAEKGWPSLTHRRHEIIDRHGQAPVELQCLGDVADDAGPTWPLQAQASMVWHLPEQGLDQRTLAAAIGADQGMDAAGLHLETHVVENRGAPKLKAD